MLYFLTYLQSFLQKPVKKDEGATAVEYGLLVAVIAIVMVVGAALLGTAIDGLFDEATATVNGPA